MYLPASYHLIATKADESAVRAIDARDAVTSESELSIDILQRMIPSLLVKGIVTPEPSVEQHVFCQEGQAHVFDQAQVRNLAKALDKVQALDQAQQLEIGRALAQMQKCATGVFRPLEEDPISSPQGSQTSMPGQIPEAIRAKQPTPDSIFVQSDATKESFISPGAAFQAASSLQQKSRIERLRLLSIVGRKPQVEGRRDSHVHAAERRHTQQHEASTTLSQAFAAPQRTHEPTASAAAQAPGRLQVPPKPPAENQATARAEKRKKLTQELEDCNSSFISFAPARPDVGQETADLPQQQEQPQKEQLQQRSKCLVEFCDGVWTPFGAQIHPDCFRWLRQALRLASESCLKKLHYRITHIGGAGLKAALRVVTKQSFRDDYIDGLRDLWEEEDKIAAVRMLLKCESDVLFEHVGHYANMQVCTSSLLLSLVLD